MTTANILTIAPNVIVESAMLLDSLFTKASVDKAGLIKMVEIFVPASEVKGLTDEIEAVHWTEEVHTNYFAEFWDGDVDNLETTILNCLEAHYPTH